MHYVGTIPSLSKMKKARGRWFCAIGFLLDVQMDLSLFEFGCRKGAISVFVVLQKYSIFVLIRSHDFRDALKTVYSEQYEGIFGKGIMLEYIEC